MTSKEISRGYAEVIERIHVITGTSDKPELALALGIEVCALNEAEKRNTIPYEWLITLLRTHNANPEWLLTGVGSRHMSPITLSCCAEYFAQEKKQTVVGELRQIPSKALADELVRRALLAGLD